MDEFNIVVENERDVDISGEIFSDFLRGEKGEKGEKGDPSELTIGTVEKGEEASASITGQSPNQVLNLVLPKGEKGDVGRAFTYEDFTQEQLDFLKGDKGDIGLTGQKGDKGETGEAGYTPIKGVDYFTNDEIEQIKQDGIIVSSTEPTENRRKVWLQNVDNNKKIYVLNNNNIYEEFIKKEEITYSTEEQKIGTWIDGKNIYRKVINYMPASTDYNYNHNIQNIYEVLPMSTLLVHRVNGQFVPSLYYNQLPKEWSIGYQFTTKMIVTWIGNEMLENIVNPGATAILYYTKTTD